jgi:hypothetical protein
MLFEKQSEKPGFFSLIVVARNRVSHPLSRTTGYGVIHLTMLAPIEASRRRI